MTRLLNFFPLLFLLLLINCSRDVPLIAPLPADARILAFGDSLTFGTGAVSSHSYPAVLAELTGLEVMNRGVPGEISADGLERLPELLDKLMPDLIVLVHGGNDILRRLSLTDTEQNLRAMVNEARIRNIPVVMLGVPSMGLLLSSAPFYEKIVGEEHIPADLEILPDILRDPDRKSDQVHPNRQGYADMASAVFSLLQKCGAVQ